MKAKEPNDNVNNLFNDNNGNNISFRYDVKDQKTILAGFTFYDEKIEFFITSLIELGESDIIELILHELMEYELTRMLYINGWQIQRGHITHNICQWVKNTTITLDKFREKINRATNSDHVCCILNHIPY